MNFNSKSFKIKRQEPNYVFNLLSGQIRKLDFTRLKGSWEMYVWNEPKSNCKKCYGRGYIGKEVKSHLKVACRCLYKNQPKLF